MNADTIRTVIEMVPGWKIYEGRYAPLQDEMAETPEGYRFFLTDQILLDYLAAAAVRVVDEMGGQFPEVLIYYNKTKIHDGTVMRYVVDGPDRTENTLLAIAEFVKGGFESE